MQPINYTLQAQDPAQSLQRGLNQGIGFLQQQQSMQIAQEQAERLNAQEARAADMHPLQMERAQVGIEAGQLGIEQQRQAMMQAEQQRARQAQFQNDMASLGQLGTGASFDDYHSAAMKYPEFSGAIKQTWNGLSQERQRGVETRLGQISAAIMSGNVELAKELTDEYAAAAANSGEASMSKTAESISQLLDVDPDAALVSLGMTSAALGFDWGKSLFGQEKDDTPAAIKSLEYRAQAAGLAPGSEEYRNFMLRGGAEKGMALEIGADGTVRMTQGGAELPSAPTVGQVYNPGEAQSTLDLISEIKSDKSLPRVVGPVIGGGGTDVDQFGVTRRLALGGEGLALVQKIEQLKSRGWLAARQMLKGGGPITDYESRKAEGAVARLSRAQSEEAFMEALNDFESAIRDGMAKLSDQGQAPTTEVSGPSAEQLQQSGLPPDTNADEYSRFMELGRKKMAGQALSQDELRFLQALMGRR